MRRVAETPTAVRTLVAGNATRIDVVLPLMALQGLRRAKAFAALVAGVEAPRFMVLAAQQKQVEQ
jgi:hypothetical protein